MILRSNLINAAIIICFTAADLTLRLAFFGDAGLMNRPMALASFIGFLAGVCVGFRIGRGY